MKGGTKPVSPDVTVIVERLHQIEICLEKLLEDAIVRAAQKSLRKKEKFSITAIELCLIIDIFIIASISALPALGRELKHTFNNVVANEQENKAAPGK